MRVWNLQIRKKVDEEPVNISDGFIALENLQEGAPREAWKHWQMLCAGRPMPSPKDLDPIAVPKLLSYTIIVDITHQPLNFVYAIVGQEFIDMFHVNPKGKSVDEFARTRPEYARAFTSVYSRVYEEKTAIAYTGMMGRNGRSLLQRECVWLPLSSDTRNVDRIWCVLKFDNIEGGA